MKTYLLFAALAGLLTACGGGGYDANGSSTGSTAVDPFTATATGVVATTPDDTEPMAIDSITATAPDDTEPTPII